MSTGIIPVDGYILSPGFQRRMPKLFRRTGGRYLGNDKWLPIACFPLQFDADEVLRAREFILDHFPIEYSRLLNPPARRKTEKLIPLRRWCVSQGITYKQGWEMWRNKTLPIPVQQEPNGRILLRVPVEI